MCLCLETPPASAIHVPLPRNVRDFGDTPRAVGAVYAAGLGYEAILYLDADNWLHPSHVETVLRTQKETGAAIVTTRRALVGMDGAYLAVCAASDGEQFCDTNCLAVFRPAFSILSQWALMAPELHAIDDRVIWRQILDKGFPRAHTGLASVYYRATYPGFYTDLGVPIPAGVKTSETSPIRSAVQFWQAMGFELPIRWGYLRLQEPSSGEPIRVPPAPATRPTESVAQTAAIYYHPEAYTTSGPKLMGRNAAGESFLRGFLAHSAPGDLWVQVAQTEHGKHFAEAARSLGRQEPVRAVTASNLGALAQVGAVYFPGPGIGENAWHRAAYGHGAWSLCGITHTTSSARAMDAIAELITTPVQPWDAVICTSTAVKDNVERVLQAQADHLAQRLGVQKLVLPQFPVIPLGIHTQDFVFSAKQRSAARKALSAGKDALVVLFMGRLSFHAKAHPLAMYRALQMAHERTGKPLVLVECGWHANDFIARAYADAAREACPAVRVVTLDGRKAEDRQTAWAGADVFCSLSDNIQETFGITPIEAMAAGLPVVVSDWDGYRDTVRDGTHGFRIPTLMPQAGLGGDLAVRHALEVDTYDMYCGHTCSLVAVDVEAATDAFVRLFESADLRRTMGEAGRQRARSVYDWAAIIPQYEALWTQLGELRRAQSPALKPMAYPWPARMDPFYAFGCYASRTLNPQTLLALTDGDAAVALQRVSAYRGLAMVDFARAVLPTADEVRLVIEAAAGGPKPAGALVEGIPAARRPFVLRGLAWLVKLGVLKTQ